MRFRRIEVKQYADGRYGFDDYSSGEQKKIRCVTKQKAQQRALDIGVALANGRPDLAQIDPARLQRLLKLEAVLEKSPSLGAAIAEFIQLKANRSSRLVKSLRLDLGLFAAFIGPERPIAAVMATDIQRFLNSRNVSDRRRHNLRASIIGLFRWARNMSYLDSDRITEAERVMGIPIVPGKVNVLGPEEMRALIANVRDQYLPWLLIGAFAGIRSEEICPDPTSKKDPLRWEDIDWQHQTIIVRAETAKTRHEREVPLLPNLAEWLSPWRNAKGPVITAPVMPTRHETSRIGREIGGWKHNALRDSFCSYRARIIQNVPQVSYEMGNSIAMVRRSYHRRQPIEAATQWFSIAPKEAGNIVVFGLR